MTIPIKGYDLHSLVIRSITVFWQLINLLLHRFPTQKLSPWGHAEQGVPCVYGL